MQKSAPRVHVLLSIACLLAAPAAGQQWPSKPIIFVSTGAADAAPRLVAEELSKVLGQPIVIDTHSGASGIVSAEYALRQPADGHTFSELGFPDIALSAWFGILARTGTPAAITTRTSAEIRKVLSKPEVRDKLLKAAVEPVGNTPEDFAVFMKTDFERWGEAAKAAGISANAPSKGP